MRELLSIIALSLFWGCAGSPTSPLEKLPDPLKLSVESFTLENGLTVLLLPDDRLPVFSLYMFYKVGGKDEVPGITGASHFLEHLMFKGTKTMSSSKFDFLVEGNGGSSNAYTSNDMTVYHVNMPTSALEMMIGVEADRMINLVIDKDEFEKERHVVLEERKMRYENSPRGQLYMQSMTELFRGTPYEASVIGEIADLKSVTRDQIYQYYQRWYAPQNTTMVIVGDIDTAKVRQLIEQHFNSIRSNLSMESEQRQSQAFATVPSSSVELNLPGQAALPMFMLSFRSAPAGSKEAYAQDLVSSILGEGKSSHLLQTYVLTAKPKVASIYAGNMTLEEGGMFMIAGELLRGADLPGFKQQLVDELRRSCDSAITERAVQKVKNQLELELFGLLETNGGMAQYLGDRQALYGDWRFYRQEVLYYRTLSVAEVQKSCHELFTQPGHVWVTVWEKNPPVVKVSQEVR